MKFTAGRIVDKMVAYVVLTMFSSAAQRLPATQYLNYSGDIMLGALFPVHKKGNSTQPCGPIFLEDGFQGLEALLFTVKEINKSGLLPGNKTLGVIAFDSCENSTRALQHSLHFVKGAIAHYNDLELHEETEFRCADGGAPKLKNGGFEKIVAVIGEHSSSVTIQVADLLKLFNIPLVSYQATSPALSNRERFPNFFRTVPSDNNAVSALLALLKKQSWLEVLVVYMANDYGLHAYERLRELAQKDNVSIVKAIKVDRDDSDDYYKRCLHELYEVSDVRVVILLLDRSVAMRVMYAASRQHMTERFLWVGSDDWNVNNTHREDGLNEVLDGALAVAPLAANLSGFDDYLKNLPPEHQLVNPWYLEYHRECEKRGYKRCRPWKYAYMVRDAAWAVAEALHELLPGHVDGPQLLERLDAVSFRPPDARANFSFGPERDGPPRYTVYNFQNGRWVDVGNYLQSENGVLQLNLNVQEMRYRHGSLEFPKSTCRPQCSPEQAKELKADGTCYTCRSCQEHEFKSNGSCVPCPVGTGPNRALSACEPLPEEYVDYSNPWAVGAMAVASFGVVATVGVWTLVWAHADTPVIKASGREVGHVLLAATLLSFGVTFLVVSKPSAATCGLRRFFVGFCTTLSNAALLVKTSRIARIFQAGATKKPRWTSPRSQLALTASLTAVEVVILASWLLHTPPGAAPHSTRHARTLVCLGLDDYSYMVALIYPFVLIGACTYYAVRTRKCPEGFNETRYIAFTNYTAIVIWLAFLPLYFATKNNSIRVITLAVSLSLSGLVQLGCLFVPKLYVVLLRPDKNTREAVMAPPRESSCYATPVVVLTGSAAERPSSAQQNSHLQTPQCSPSPRFWRSENRLVASLSALDGRPFPSNGVLNTSSPSVDAVNDAVRY